MTGKAWVDVPLAAVGQIVTGTTPSSGDVDAWGSDVPFLTPTDIVGSTRFVRTGRHLSQRGVSRLRTRLLPNSSVCFTCIGATIGKMCMTSGLTVTNQQINSIVVDKERFDPVFVYFNLRHHSRRIAGMASGSATPIINKEAFGRQRLSFPGLGTQRAIAEVLGTLDDKIEAIRTLAKKAECLAVALPASTVATTTVGAIAAVCHKLVPTAFFATRAVEHFSLPAFDAGRLPIIENGDGIKSGKFLLEGATVLVSKLNPHIPRVWIQLGDEDGGSLQKELAALDPIAVLDNGEPSCIESWKAEVLDGPGCEKGGWYELVTDRSDSSDCGCGDRRCRKGDCKALSFLSERPDRFDLIVEGAEHLRNRPLRAESRKTQALPAERLLVDDRCRRATRHPCDAAGMMPQVEVDEDGIEAFFVHDDRVDLLVCHGQAARHAHLANRGSDASEADRTVGKETCPKSRDSPLRKVSTSPYKSRGPDNVRRSQERNVASPCVHVA